MSNSVFPSSLFFDLADTLMYSINNQDYLYEDCLDTLQLLHQRGYRLGLLSNQSSGTTLNQVYDRLDNLGLLKYIERDLVVISTEIPGNIGKPNQPIFDLALQKAGHSEASQLTIFVTETVSHINAARSYGWRAILKRNTGVCQASDGDCVTGLVGLLNLLLPIGNIAGTNFHLAPYPKLVDGLWAVPIDISKITATLDFDGSNSSGNGTAILDFKLGRHTGCPIFDLRQTITALWIDGVPFDVTKATHHDFGGGTGAELRILEIILEAGTTHQLQVNYTLGPPQASTAGSYLPQIIWSAGPRLLFNFGFTDLGPGRYLESWIPANLIFDQYELLLTIRVLNTPINHSLITNGSVVNLGLNQWQTSFPSFSSAFSPLLELRSTDSVTSYIDSVTLPVSGDTITIEAWKLLTNTVDLTTQVNFIKNFLSNNEQNIGDYLHGNRFVAFIHQGGMEYDGGTTTGTMALEHETYHSWWGRGLKPASQPDSWMDEAWTTYQVDTGPSSVPFNFTSPAVQLCPTNKWVRKTAGGSYTDGATFWRGIAGYTSTAVLDTIMSEFYQYHNGKPFTTPDLEKFLLSKVGEPMIVDAFHRFIYGFPNPSPLPDVWLRDHFDHEGSENWVDGSFWNSPDLWIRNNDDDLLSHQDPVSGQNNWIYARVRNLSNTQVVDHFAVVFNVKPYAGIEFLYPQDFLPGVASATGFNLPPNSSVIVKAMWPANMVPTVGTHACLLASVFSRLNHPLSNKHVWEQNSLAQKNLTIVSLLPDTWIVLPFLFSSLWSGVSNMVNLELIRSKKDLDVKAELIHIGSLKPAKSRRKKDNILKPESGIDRIEVLLEKRFTTEKVLNVDHLRQEIITSSTPKNLDIIFPNYQVSLFPSGLNAQIPIKVTPNSQQFFGLRVYVPKGKRKGDVININLIKRDAKSKKVLGGIALSVHVS
jgi:hypothetical protein